MGTIVPLAFSDQPITAAQGTYTGINGGDIFRFQFINSTSTLTLGFAIAGGSNSTEKPTGISSFPSGDVEANAASWRWETGSFDVVQSQWALFPYDGNTNPWTNVYCYAEEIQAPRSDPLFAGSVDNLAWDGGSSSFDTWLQLSSDQQYSWTFSATGDNSGGDGSPLYWYGQFDIWIYSDLLGNGAPTNPPASQGQVTNLGRVELQLTNSTP